MINEEHPFFRLFVRAWSNHDYQGLEDVFRHIILEDNDYIVAKMAAENITHYTPSPCHALVLSKMPAGLKKDAFVLAAKMWGAEDLYLWLEHIDPKDYILGLSAAADAGITDSVELLAPLTDCTQMDSEPLRWAAANNDTDCVKILLPYSNPKDCESEALYWACYYKNTELADLLIPVSDCVSLRAQFEDRLPQENQSCVDFLDQRISVLQRVRLTDRLNIELSEQIKTASAKRKI